MVAVLTLDDLIGMMQPLTEGDYIKLDEWVRSAFVAAARNSVPDLEVGSQLWEATMAVAMKESLGLTFLRKPGSALLLSSKAGLARAAWQCAYRHNGGKLTVEQVMAAIPTGADEVKLFHEWCRINGFTRKTQEEAKPPENPPNT